jgi:sulfate permease, SulP family
MNLSLPKYSWRSLTGDAFGGAIAALIALPYGLAMASLMGLPPVLGIFTSLLTAPVTALLGRNPVMIGGTASVTVPFVAIAVKQQGLGGAAKVTLVAAVFMMAFSVLRMGRYITRIPSAVVSGFSCGIGAMMVVSQLRTIFGLNIAPSGASSTLLQLTELLEHITELRFAPVLLGAIVILSCFLIARRLPKAPAPLIGVVLACGFSALLGLHEKEVGRLALELPPLAGFTWNAADVYTVLPSGLGMAIVTSINLLITSRVVDHFRGRHRAMKAIDAEKELGAYGIANVCVGIFGAPMSIGIPARSLANVRCGGTTRVSNLAHVLFLALFLGAGAAAVARIPVAALAGITAYVGICLLEWSTWRRLAKMRTTDAAAFLLTAFCTLFSNAIAAVAIGCSVYLIVALVERLRSPLPLFAPAGE